MPSRKTIGGSALLELVIEDTHSCYLGDRSRVAMIGVLAAANVRPAELRAAGFAKWKNECEKELMNNETRRWLEGASCFCPVLF